MRPKVRVRRVEDGDGKKREVGRDIGGWGTGMNCTFTKSLEDTKRSIRTKQ